MRVPASQGGLYSKELVNNETNTQISTPCRITVLYITPYFENHYAVKNNMQQMQANQSKRRRRLEGHSTCSELKTVQHLAYDLWHLNLLNVSPPLVL